MDADAATQSMMLVGTTAPVPLTHDTLDEEVRLVVQAKAGVPSALQHIARLHEAGVRRMLLRMLGARADLDDLVQNVFVEFCRALPRFRGESKLSTFIGGITVRIAKRAMRPSAWFRRRGDWAEEPVSHDPPVDTRSEAAEQLRRTRRLLAKISEKKRIAFMLWALEGLSIEEIAEMTNTSPSATQSRVYYAQKELRALAAKDPALMELVG